MKLVLFDKKEAEQEVYIKNMTLLSIADYEKTDSDYTVQFMYCARDEHNNLVVFCQYFKSYYKDGDANLFLSSLESCPYYETNKKNPIITTITGFFLNDDNIPVRLTDFSCEYDSEKDKYNFIGYTNNIGTKYYIDKKIFIGINILYKTIKSYSLGYGASLTTAVSWISGEVNGEFHTFENVVDYKITDISRTARLAKKLHTGFAAVEFTIRNNFNDEEKVQCIIRYVTDRKKRNSITVNPRLMEISYKDALFIYPYYGQAINPHDHRMQLYTYDTNKNIFHVFFIKEDMYTSLLNEIFSI